MDLVERKKVKPIFGEKPFIDWKKAPTLELVLDTNSTPHEEMLKY